MNHNINKREDIVAIIPHGAIGCEIGVFEGDYSQILVDSNKFTKLYLVDIFDGVASSGDKYGNNIKTYSDASVLLKHNKERFEAYSVVEVVQKDSISFLESFDSFFDFIYIDTVHTYDFTMRELEAGYCAIKNGGKICGHDYNYQQYPGVVDAIKEFTTKYKLNYFTTSQDILESFIITK